MPPTRATFSEIAFHCKSTSVHVLDKSNDVGRAHASIMGTQMLCQYELHTVVSPWRRGVEATGRPFKSEPFIANCGLGLGAVLKWKRAETMPLVSELPTYPRKQHCIHHAATHTFMPEEGMDQEHRR